MRTWVVVYQTNMGFIYGWLCKVQRPSDAEEEFWRVMDTTAGKTIKCIADLDSILLDACFSLYEEKERY